MTAQPLPTQKHTQEVQSSRTWSSALEALEAGRLEKRSLWGLRAFIKHLEAVMRLESTDLFFEAPML